jgi:hypothetical protein
MRHRLPLSGNPVTNDNAVWTAPPRPLPWPAIAVADTARGVAALELALALGEAAHELAVPVRFRLLDFAHAPVLPAGFAARFAALGDVHAQSLDRALAVALDASALELWVGLPALVAFTPDFGILLGVDRPRLEWPSALRRVAVQLALTSVRPGLARALLEELNRRGFLPVVGHGVR